MLLGLRLLLRQRAEAEGDASMGRVRMFVDVGQALLDNSIDMRRSRSLQRSEVSINLKRDLQLPTG